MQEHSTVQMLMRVINIGFELYEAVFSILFALKEGRIVNPMYVISRLVQ